MMAHWRRRAVFYAAMNADALRRSLRRVLICRTDNIGDVVLTLPLAGYLRQHFPDIEIDFLVRGYAAPVVRLSGNVRQVYSLEEIGEEVEFFAKGQWDSVIFAFPQRRLAKAAKKAKIANRLGTSHRLFHWLYCNRLAHFSRVNSPLHEAQLNFALLKPLGIAVQPRLSDIIAWYGMQALPDPAHEKFVRPLAKHIILHPKSNGNGREWPLASFLQLVQNFAQDNSVQFWLTGSAKEGDFLAAHAPELLQQTNLQNLCGQLDLAGLASLMARADGLIASGTGPLHMAAALGRPCLGLFPPVKPIDPARWGALGAQAQVLVAPQPCSSCTGAAQCQCMQAITPAQVAAVVRAW